MAYDKAGRERMGRLSHDMHAIIHQILRVLVPKPSSIS